ncbi:MAG: riboflavin biosynthesis protein RibF [Kyrpidia tusciae]|nr:riboflavin biosynthesis protein RibF [Kyrpidia tusciae]MBE3553081.1 riboflavin biosynthesis protein RibF [Kyrpidia tusciae]
METIRLTLHEHWSPPSPSVMALGTFDGLHIGHQEILSQGKAEAKRRGVPFAVFLCDPHPRQVLGIGAEYDVLLTPLPEKLRLLEHYGADLVYILLFTREVAAVAPEQFVLDLLLPLAPEVLVAGFDYTFGAGGKGDAALLKAMGETRALPVFILPPVNRYGEKVSSSLIREKLRYGEVKLVRELLGRPYALTGRVVKGEGRGIGIGFPTANLQLNDPFLIPGTGVYLVRAFWGMEKGPGLMNIGVRPTFHDRGTLSLEVHLLDHRVDLYGEEMRVEFLDYLRPEQRFNSVDRLVAQIEQDVRTARDLWRTAQGDE